MSEQGNTPGNQTPWEQQSTPSQPSQGGWGQAPQAFGAQQVPPQQQYPSAASDPSAWQGQQQPAAPDGNALGSEAKGLIGSLFDFSFRHFATPKIVRIAYILSAVLIGLFALGMLVSAFAMINNDEGALGFLTLVATPLVALFYLAMVRMSMEMYVALTRMADDLGQLRRELRERR